MSELAPSELLKLFRQMVLIRRFEEKSAELYSEGKIGGFLHLYIGEEAVAVGACQALGAQDHLLGYERCSYSKSHFVSDNSSCASSLKSIIKRFICKSLLFLVRSFCVIVGACLTPTKSWGMLII